MNYSIYLLCHSEVCLEKPLQTVKRPRVHLCKLFCSPLFKSVHTSVSSYLVWFPVILYTLYGLHLPLSCIRLFMGQLLPGQSSSRCAHIWTAWVCVHVCHASPKQLPRKMSLVKVRVNSTTVTWRHFLYPLSHTQLFGCGLIRAWKQLSKGCAKASLSFTHFSEKNKTKKSLRK